MKTKVIITILVISILYGANIAQAGIVNPNSVVVDDIEYYIQTDKSVYNLGENVEMLYKVTNLRDVSVTFDFPVDPVYQFEVEQGGEQIWNAPKFVYFIETSITLLPGEYKEFPLSPPLVWNMRDNEDNLVDIGTYNVIGRLYGYDFSEVSVPINIVPEPITISLLGAGILLLRKAV